MVFIEDTPEWAKRGHISPRTKLDSCMTCGGAKDARHRGAFCSKACRVAYKATCSAEFFCTRCGAMFLHAMHHARTRKLCDMCFHAAKVRRGEHLVNVRRVKNGKKMGEPISRVLCVARKNDEMDFPGNESVAIITIMPTAIPKNGRSAKNIR